MAPHAWQCEELLRLGGYLNPYDRSVKYQPTVEDPYLLTLPAANGSGKDQYIIAAFAVWHAMKGLRNRCIITSSSHEQVKNQTEPHIAELCARVNKFFPGTFRSVQFHHTCLTTGSEIKMFATDDPKYAEGYHPWPGGEMAIIINEAKSVSEEIFNALTRCTGYSYWLEISSPAGRSGRLYRDACKAIEYPETLVLGKFYKRHISAFECSHIPRSHIERQIEEMPEWWVDSSIRALFSDAADDVIVPGHYITALALKLPEVVGSDIGIGLDLAGGVDENAVFVRKGNKVIFKYFFRQKDTDATADFLDRELTPWKDSNYTFNSDDGGISKAINDKLVKLGWRINRCNNQSPARDKSRYLNLGIEMWYKLRHLIIRKEIHETFDEPILHSQLTSRRLHGEESVQGKLRIEPKPKHKSRMGSSPDRADAFVLCFYSYRSNYFDKPATTQANRRPIFTSTEALEAYYSWGEGSDLPVKSPSIKQQFSQQTIVNI
jgi:hypothetical protein